MEWDKIRVGNGRSCCFDHSSAKRCSGYFLALVLLSRSLVFDAAIIPSLANVLCRYREMAQTVNGIQKKAQSSK